MNHSQRRPVLLLPFYLLALLISLPFAFAQSSNDTRLFTLVTGSIVTICTTSTLMWIGGNTVPPYNVYMARGDGPVGNDSSLGAEWLVDTVKDTTSFVYIESDWGQSFDMHHWIRFIELYYYSNGW